VGGRVAVLVDSGFRRGTDIAKALAMARRACASAGPTSGAWAPSARRCVEKVLELLRIELRVTMQQTGAPTIKHLVPAMVRRA